MRSKLIAFVGIAFVAAGGSAVQAQDAAAGKKVFNKCRACHVVDKEQNRIGPYLVGLFGREAGTVESFNYSDAMKGSGIVWTDETLAAYVADPKGFVPGNKMSFAGLKDEQDIQDLIAYLHEATGS
jgi:cytochrome c